MSAVSISLCGFVFAIWHPCCTGWPRTGCSRRPSILTGCKQFRDSLRRHDGAWKTAWNNNDIGDFFDLFFGGAMIEGVTRMDFQEVGKAQRGESSAKRPLTRADVEYAGAIEDFTDGKCVNRMGKKRKVAFQCIQLCPIG